MIREHRHLVPVSTLWFYPAKSDDPMPVYQATCCIAWEGDGTAWVYGFMGKVSRRNLRDFLAFCLERGVYRLKAKRRDGHTLPGAVQIGDHLEVDLQALKARVG